MRRILALTFATAALGLMAGSARAQCPSGAGYVVIAGSTAAKNIIATVGPILANQGTTVVYQGGGSCTGLEGIYTGTTPAGVGSATIYYPDGGTASCTVGTTPGDVPTLVASDVYASTCLNAGAFSTIDAIPPGFLEYLGPWQAMLFIQPVAATAPPGIAAEQAYWVLGFPPNGGAVSPWDQPNENDTTDAGFLFMRSKGSGTQQMLSTYVYPGNPTAVNWVVVNAGGSGGVVNSVGNYAGTSPNSVMGILSLDAYGPNKTTLRSLPFRAYNQLIAWYPDSSQNANDRQNVRDGHYQPAGPVHFVAASTDGTSADDPGAQAFINVLNGTTDLGDTNIVAVEASVYTTPDCAMKVTKTVDGADVSNYTPAHFCGCAFESDVGATTSLVPYACVACTCATGTDCTGTGNTCTAGQPICNYGFCEAQ